MKITIPKPCNENWDSMSPVEKGRFCSICSKKVHDFTTSTQSEIAAALKAEPGICGIFDNRAVDVDQEFSFINSMFLKFAVGFMLTAGGFVAVQAQTTKAKAGKPVAQGQTVPRSFPLGIIEVYHPPMYILNGKTVTKKTVDALKPERILDMNVLDATAAQKKYGDKGRYGAVVIHTKRKK